MARLSPRAPAASTLLIAALLALTYAARPAKGAFDCSSITGCAACAYQFNEKDGATALVCTACAGPAYVLQASKNRCNCAPGHYSRLANGTELGECKGAPAGMVAAAGAVNSAGNAARACLANSIPADSSTRCLCIPGFYAATGGQTPRCEACGMASYTDAPNARASCRACAVGYVANAARTACEPLAAALTLRGKNASTTTAATVTTAAAATNNTTTTSAASVVNATATTNATTTTNSTTNANATATLGSRLSAVAARANHTLVNATAAVEDALQKAAARANATVHGLVHRSNATAPWVQQLVANATQRANATLAAYEARLANATAVPAIIARLNVTQLADTPLVARALNATGAASLQAAWKALQAKGLALPAMTSLFKGVAPAASVPGLSTGSANGVEALARVAKAVWANPDYRDIVMSSAAIIVKAIASYAGR